MTRTELDEALKEVFGDMFDIEPSEIIAETSPDTLSNWDSLAHVRLISALEERFAVRIPPEDQVDMLTFELVGDVIGEKLGAQS